MHYSHLKPLHCDGQAIIAGMSRLRALWLQQHFYYGSVPQLSIVAIGVAPITQVTVIKIVTLKGGHLMW